MFSFRKSLYFPIFALFLLQAALGGIFFYEFYLSNIRNSVESKFQAIEKDIKIQGRYWDLSLYSTDPRVIGSYPLYLISIDGSVVDRRQPIKGFLDVSDFSRWLTYKKPVTVITPANVLKRVMARPINSQGQTLGIIVVSSSTTDPEIISKTDEQLADAASYIYSGIKVHSGGEIDASGVDPRKIKYNVAFSVIDRYNTVIKRNENVNNIGRVPSYIDPSYVKELLSSPQEKIVRDSESGEAFLMRIQPFKMGSNVAGVVAIGQSISFIYPFLLKYFIFQILVGLLLSAICLKMIKKYQKDNKGVKKTLKMPSTIAFDDKASVLILDENKIKIPFATNQYYFLKAVFSSTTKRWETDELLEKFGEVEMDPNNWRKVYDTMIGINKKVEEIIPVKLVINQDKTYQLNPELFS